ncbi:MTERF5 [Symbiodinium sp. CCMP2592]|nr:MTERF5 [Symbiodinium sp. CCMP2592]
MFSRISWRSFRSCSLCVVRQPPAWWKAGHRRQRPDSVAEAELLARLAVILQPEEPIKELFRDFRVKKSDGRSRSTLSPDLTVYGALQAEDAALFLEYDGYYRHLLPAGIAADSKKTHALLDFAPAGSQVVRIAHARREWDHGCDMGEVVIDVWQQGRDASLAKALRQVTMSLLKQLGSALQPGLRAKLQAFVETPGGISWTAAVEFTEKAFEFDQAPLHEFLQMQLELSFPQAEELLKTCPALARLDIEEHLEPVRQFLEDFGLEKAQVVKVIVRYPPLLGYRIEEHLKPTVQWLRDVGLTKADIAKLIVRTPQVLGCSIAANLKPTVQWLRDLGLTKADIAKVIVRAPQVLGCSIEENLKPTVQWLRDVGLTNANIAKVIVRAPRVLGCSIAENLKPTVQWLRDLGLTKADIAKLIVRTPQVLGCSIAANLKPTVQWLRDLGLTKADIAKVIVRAPQVLGCSIEENLKPTVQWLRDVGLTNANIAKVIVRFPHVLGYSIEENLKPTAQWLRDLGLTKAGIAKVIFRFPQVLGCSIEENLKPTVQWLRNAGLTNANIAKVIVRSPQVLGYSIEENLNPKVLWLLERFSSEFVCGLYQAGYRDSSMMERALAIVERREMAHPALCLEAAKVRINYAAYLSEGFRHRQALQIIKEAQETLTKLLQWAVQCPPEDFAVQALGREARALHTAAIVAQAMAVEYCADDDDELDTPEGPDEAAKETARVSAAGLAPDHPLAMLVRQNLGTAPRVMGGRRQSNLGTSVRKRVSNIPLQPLAPQRPSSAGLHKEGTEPTADMLQETPHQERSASRGSHRRSDYSASKAKPMGKEERMDVFKQYLRDREMARVAHLLALSDDWETQTRKKLFEVHKQTKFQLELVNVEELKEKRYTRVGHKVFMQNMKNSNKCWSNPDISREARKDKTAPEVCQLKKLSRKIYVKPPPAPPPPPPPKPKVDASLAGNMKMSMRRGSGED